MQLGNPTGATPDPNNHTNYLIRRAVEAIGYSDLQGQPIWASWDLTSSDIGSSGRTDAWAVDTNLPPTFNRIPTSAYGSVNGQSYDRGHMCPSADRTDTVADNQQVFIMSNIIPQASQQNQGVWENLESYSRTLLGSQELLITSGPYDFGPYTVDGGLVGIASNTFKIIVCVPLGSGVAFSRITNTDPNSIRVIAVDIPNTGGAGSIPWTSFVTSTKQIQSKTGYNFFNALPNNLAWVLRSKIDGQTPATPGFITFSPTSGAANSTVVLAGADLDTVTNVSFNGVVASYNIDSPTQISAIVPPGAGSGPIIVRGMGGNSAGPFSFTVSSEGGPDLTLTTSHTGSFTQGDIGDSYAITVRNVGGAASSDAVTVTDALPAGLTATAITGAGWTTDLATLTGTRSDALAAGAAYPPLTITVNVATNAAALVTNSATVLGGGDANAANNTANDPTTINPPPLTDLAITSAHARNFTQGDIDDIYVITVTNLGTRASSGTVTVTDALPAGLIATAIAGAGWTADLAALTAARSDALSAGASYPPLIVTVNVAPNAPAAVTNLATVSGGGDADLADNVAADLTTINTAGSGGAIGTLVGWDTSALSNYGPSPFSPITNAAHLTVAGLTRGPGVGTSGTGAARGWGGNTFTSASSAAAASSGQYAMFAITANTGYQVSCSSITRFDYRRSSTGPTSGVLQYQIGSGGFNDIATVSYSSSSSSGASLPAINLSGISALQNVGPGTNISFRIVNWGGTSSGGTWYVFDAANSGAPDLVLEGSVSPLAPPNLPSVADLAVISAHSGNFTQGDTGDIYSITVTNVGSSNTVGAVSVTNLLPAGLMATAISGVGWTANLGPLTAARSDSLPPGAAYPPLFVTVNVSPTAPPVVTNLVTVSWNGQTNLLNDTSSHPISIGALQALSPFSIAAATFINPNQFAITWGSVSGRTYQVQSATSLLTPKWMTNANLTATAGSTSWTNPAAYGPVGFYRVVAAP